MSKRKNRSKQSPNIPQETLDRAREQLARGQEQAEKPPAENLLEASDNSSPADVGFTPPPAEKPVATKPASASRDQASEAAKAGLKPASAAINSASRARSRRRAEVLTPDMVKERLENPTRLVSEEELQQEYNYVLRDLRSMGLLAAALMVVLVVLAQLL